MALTNQEKRDRQLDAERAVIGSMLIDPDVVRGILTAVSEKDFLNPANRLVYQAARDLFRSGEPVDAVTVRSRVGEQYTDYLVQLMEITPTAANWEAYAREMREQTRLQRAKDLGLQLTQAAALEDCRPVGAELSRLLADGQQLRTWNMRELLESFFESQDPNAPPVQYIGTGFRAVDQGTYIELGDVVVIGGYPSGGKTAMALQMAWHMSQAYRVGFFSLETNRKKFRDRLMASSMQLDFSAIKRRTLSDGDWNRVAQGSGEFTKRSLTMIEASGMSASDIQSVSRAYGFQIIFIDYVQQVRPEKGRIRSEEMAGVSNDLHIFAQSSGTLVVELAQLSRQEQGVSRDGKKKWREPTMHDLKESGQFEQDADLILLLFRPGPGDRDLDGERHRILKIAKNKEGRWGSWPLYFDGEKQTFSPLTRTWRSLGAGLGRPGGKKAEPEYRQTEIEELPPVGEDMPF